MSPTGETNLRRVGGPPRKAVPKTTSSSDSTRPRAISVSSTEQPKGDKDSQGTSKEQGSASKSSSTKKSVALRPNPSIVSALEFEEEDDDDWDEVALTSETHQTREDGDGLVPRDYGAGVSSPANASTSRAGSRALTLTDEDTAGTTETEGEGDGDDDLLAAYAYDFDAEKREKQAKKAETGDIEISLGARDGLTEEQRQAAEELANRKKPLTARDRALRLEAHKFQIICLLANAGVRNKWCSDDLLKARLLSLTPHAFHAAFHIPPSRYPDAMQRGRMFQTALQDLATWWANDFFQVTDTTIGIKTRNWDDVMEIVEKLPRLVQNAGIKVLFNGGFDNVTEAAKSGTHLTAKESLDPDVVEKFVEALGPGGERIRTVNSMMKKALQGKGGRDTSAQLFVSLCRSLGLGARMVVSLQPVQWRADKHPTKSNKSKKAASKPTTPQDTLAKTPKRAERAKKVVRRKGKPPAKTQSEEEEEEEMEEVSLTGSTKPPATTPQPAVPNIGTGGAMNPLKKERAEYYRLGKSKADATRNSVKTDKKPKKMEDLHRQPPVFWAEVYSRSEQKWIPVDPVRGTIKSKKHFEPSSETGPVRILYVVAFEEDGYARDVTVRYARNFAAKTMKLRVPVKKDHEDWWARVLKMLERPYRLHRDDLEDAELEMSQVSEGMPMVMGGFKDHPLYVLERHLKREEVIMPKREIGRFKGEPVYKRENVVSCKTPENWMRIGRVVKAGQEPLKWVKQRAVTLDKRRAQELEKMEGKEPTQQGIYAEWQTELFRPPPIRDGKVPKNTFGNLDLYTPTMLPEGAVHLPYKGIAKVARQLGVDYAEACTGFEFKKQRAIPVLTGIVVAEEYETQVLDAYWKSTAAAEERALNKKQQRALERWFKLLNGIRIRKRVQAQYQDGTDGLRLSNSIPPRPSPLSGNTKKSAATPKPKRAAAAAASSRQSMESTFDADDNEVDESVSHPKTNSVATSPSPKQPPPQPPQPPTDRPIKKISIKLNVSHPSTPNKNTDAVRRPEPEHVGNRRSGRAAALNARQKLKQSSPSTLDPIDDDDDNDDEDDDDDGFKEARQPSTTTRTLRRSTRSSRGL